LSYSPVRKPSWSDVPEITNKPRNDESLSRVNANATFRKLIDDNGSAILATSVVRVSLLPSLRVPFVLRVSVDSPLRSTVASATKFRAYSPCHLSSILGVVTLTRCEVCVRRPSLDAAISHATWVLVCPHPPACLSALCKKTRPLKKNTRSKSISRKHLPKPRFLGRSRRTNDIVLHRHPSWKV
jgi:hypothetical protein